MTSATETLCHFIWLAPWYVHDIAFRGTKPSIWYAMVSVYEDVHGLPHQQSHWLQP